MISRACYVSCDNCGDPAPVSTDNAEDAREIARGEGYVRERVAGRLADLCPKCVGVTSLDGVRLRRWNYALGEELPEGHRYDRTDHDWSDRHPAPGNCPRRSLHGTGGDNCPSCCWERP